MQRSKNKHRVICLVSLCLLIAGCATPPSIPAELQYRPPESGLNTATILGSQEKSSWADDFTAYISSIDGKRVMLERKGWDFPIILDSGTRSITAEFQRGVFNTRVVIPVNVEAGRSYRLRFSSDVGIGGRNTYCDFWIEDIATSKAVSGIFRGSIAGGMGGGAYVPVFIPAK
jgi:hypothetical protein